jgi:hypothetical protein
MWAEKEIEAVESESERLDDVHFLSLSLYLLVRVVEKEMVLHYNKNCAGESHA